MKRRLMLEQWNLFAKLLPRECSEIQRKETRRAFYAGAQCILFRVIESLASESEPTEQDLQIMSDLHQELQDFARNIKEGKA